MYALTLTLALIGQGAVGLSTGHLAAGQGPVLYRQMLCILPEPGAPPCTGPVDNVQYETLYGRNAAGSPDSDELEWRNDEKTLLSGEEVEQLEFDDIEPSSWASDDIQLVGQAARLRRQSDEEVSEPRQLAYPERIVNSPMVAKLVARGCVPDVGIPVCQTTPYYGEEQAKAVASEAESESDLLQRLPDDGLGDYDLGAAGSLADDAAPAATADPRPANASGLASVIQSKKDLVNKTLAGIIDKHQAVLQLELNKLQSVINATLGLAHPVLKNISLLNGNASGLPNPLQWKADLVNQTVTGLIAKQQLALQHVLNKLRAVISATSPLLAVNGSFNVNGTQVANPFAWKASLLNQTRASIIAKQQAVMQHLLNKLQRMINLTANWQAPQLAINASANANASLVPNTFAWKKNLVNQTVSGIIAKQQAALQHVLNKLQRVVNATVNWPRPPARNTSSVNYNINATNPFQWKKDLVNLTLARIVARQQAVLRQVLDKLNLVMNATASLTIPLVAHGNFSLPSIVANKTSGANNVFGWKKNVVNQTLANILAKQQATLQHLMNKLHVNSSSVPLNASVGDGSILGAVSNVFNQKKNIVVDAVSSVAERKQNAVKNVIKGVGDAIDKVHKTIVDTYDMAINLVTDFKTELRRTKSAILQAMIDHAAEKGRIVSDLVNEKTKAVSNIFEKKKATVASVFNETLNFEQAIVDKKHQVVSSLTTKKINVVNSISNKVQDTVSLAGMVPIYVTSVIQQSLAPSPVADNTSTTTTTTTTNTTTAKPTLLDREIDQSLLEEPMDERSAGRSDDALLAEPVEPVDRLQRIVEQEERAKQPSTSDDSLPEKQAQLEDGEAKPRYFLQNTSSIDAVRNITVPSLFNILKQQKLAAIEQNQKLINKWFGNVFNNSEAASTSTPTPVRLDDQISETADSDESHSSEEEDMASLQDATKSDGIE